MSINQPLLAATRNNAEMGAKNLEQVLPMIEDRDLKSVVQVQRDEYNRILMSADTLLRADGQQESGNVLAKAMSSVSLAFNTLTNKSAPHIAHLLVEGTDMGIQDIDAALTQYGAGATPESYNLATTLRDFLYRNRRELQRFE